MTEICLHFLCAHYITDSLLCAQVVAILEGQFDVCKMLCEDYGADVNSKGPCGQSLLHYACATVRPGEQPVSSYTMRVELIGHSKPCMTDFYLHI